LPSNAGDQVDDAGDFVRPVFKALCPGRAFAHRLSKMFEAGGQLGNAAGSVVGHASGCFGDFGRIAGIVTGTAQADRQFFQRCRGGNGDVALVAHTVIAAFGVAAGFGCGAGELVRHPGKVDEYAGKGARHGVDALGERCKYPAARRYEAGDQLSLRQRHDLHLDQVQSLCHPAGGEPLGGQDEDEDQRRQSLRGCGRAGDAGTTGDCGEGAGHELKTQA